MEEKNIQVFSNSEFGSLTTITIDGEPWFIGKEVAEKLGYERGTKAVIDHVDSEDKQVFLKSHFRNLESGNSKVLENIPNRGLTCINESGLYSLILSSKLPSAKKFKHWVTSEVLPTIRKHGVYMTDEAIEKAILNPDFIVQLATQLKEEKLKRLEAEQRNTELSATNAALTKQTNTWDDSAIINSLIRAYASYRCLGVFAKAYNIFYKKLNYSLHINLRSRRVKSTNQKAPLIDFIKKEEMPDALKIAVAMCEESGIETGTIISETNMEKVSA